VILVAVAVQDPIRRRQGVAPRQQTQGRVDHHTLVAPANHEAVAVGILAAPLAEEHGHGADAAFFEDFGQGSSVDEADPSS
jgi:hypothetical protein